MACTLEETPDHLGRGRVERAYTPRGGMGINDIQMGWFVFVQRPYWLRLAGESPPPDVGHISDQYPILISFGECDIKPCEKTKNYGSSSHGWCVTGLPPPPPLRVRHCMMGCRTEPKIDSRTRNKAPHSTRSTYRAFLLPYRYRCWRP